MLSKPIYKDMN